MADSPNKTTTMGVTVQIPMTTEIRKYLEDNAFGDLPVTLSKWLTFWLENTAGGGLMLEAVDVELLSKLAGKPFMNSKQVIQMVQVALRREEGQCSFTVQIDPGWFEPLKEIAVSQGRASVEEMLTEFVNDVIEEVWGYNLHPDRVARFTLAQWKEVQEITGRASVTGTDILKSLQELKELRSARGRKAA